MADLRRGLRRPCVRSLHAARSHADRAAGAYRNAARERGASTLQSVGGNSLLCSGDCRRRFRIARRLSDRLAGPAPHPEVEYCAVRGVHFGQRGCNEPHTIPAAALRHVCRRLGGIRRRHGLAGGAIYAARTARSHHRLYAGICLNGRPANQRRLLSRRHVQPALPADPRRARSLALYPHVRTESRTSPDRAAAISSRIADLETKETPRNAETAELCRTLSPGISQDCADHVPDDGLLVRGIVWHAATFRANHSRHARSENSPRGGAGTAGRLFAGHAGAGRTCRTLPDVVSGGTHFEPAPLAAPVS